jgi:hypothetical protein
MVADDDAVLTLWLRAKLAAKAGNLQKNIDLLERAYRVSNTTRREDPPRLLKGFHWNTWYREPSGHYTTYPTRYCSDDHSSYGDRPNCDNQALAVELAISQRLVNNDKRAFVWFMEAGKIYNAESLADDVLPTDWLLEYQVDHPQNFTMKRMVIRRLIADGEYDQAISLVESPAEAAVVRTFGHHMTAGHDLSLADAERGQHLWTAAQMLITETSILAPYYTNFDYKNNLYNFDDQNTPLFQLDPAHNAEKHLNYHEDGRDSRYAAQGLAWEASLLIAPYDGLFELVAAASRWLPPWRTGFQLTEILSRRAPKDPRTIKLLKEREDGQSLPSRAFSKLESAAPVAHDVHAKSTGCATAVRPPEWFSMAFMVGLLLRRRLTWVPVHTTPRGFAP